MARYVRYPSTYRAPRNVRLMSQGPLPFRLGTERELLTEFFTWASANWERLSDTTIGDAVDLYLREQKP